MNTNPNPVNKVWNWIWKLQIPQKLKNFSWFTHHDRVLSNKLRCERHLVDEAICLRCHISCESTLISLEIVPKPTPFGKISVMIIIEMLILIWRSRIGLV